jgi:hypothetical protein
VVISDGELNNVHIVDNEILWMGASGIAVAHYSDISVNELLIDNNHIHDCSFLRLTDIREEFRESVAYGGISLAYGNYIVIRNNAIENNGSTHHDPICGIFILHGEGITIDGNRILHNGSIAGHDTRLGPGERGGIVISMAHSQISPIWLSEGSAIHEKTGRVSSARLPAVRAHENVVVAPEGRALKVLAIGPVSAEGNQFVSHGSNSLNQVPLSTNMAAGTKDFSAEIAASVPITNRAETANPLTAFLDALGGSVVSIVNLGVSNEIYLQLINFFSQGATISESDKTDAEATKRPFLAGGNVLFNDNQVTFDALGPVVTLSLSSVLLISLDDVSMVGNQSDCDLTFDFVGTNSLVIAGSLRMIGNRFKEGVFNAFFSALTLGWFNTTTDNQGTHCFFSVGHPHLSANGNNRVLLDLQPGVGNACARLKGPQELLTKLFFPK